MTFKNDNFTAEVQKFGVRFAFLIFADEISSAASEMREWKSSFRVRSFQATESQRKLSKKGDKTIIQERKKLAVSFHI